MKKIKVWRTDYDFSKNLLEGKLKKVIKNLLVLHDKYYDKQPKLVMNGFNDGIELIFIDEETDKEYEYRTSLAKRKREQTIRNKLSKQQKEKKQYELLKKKFEGKVKL